MGLDMYLEVRQHISRVDWKDVEAGERPEFRSVVQTAGLTDMVQPEGYQGATVEVPVYYWRKANAIHQFFVDRCAEGEDNCQPMYVSTTVLEELVKKCDEVLKNPDDAQDILPTQSGFFFGPTDYDEYYFGQVAETRDDIRAMLDKISVSTGDFDLLYQASW